MLFNKYIAVNIDFVNIKMFRVLYIVFNIHILYISVCTFIHCISI